MSKAQPFVGKFQFIPSGTNTPVVLDTFYGPATDVALYLTTASWPWNSQGQQKVLMVIIYPNQYEIVDPGHTWSDYQWAGGFFDYQFFAYVTFLPNHGGSIYEFTFDMTVSGFPTGANPRPDGVAGQFDLWNANNLAGALGWGPNQTDPKQPPCQAIPYQLRMITQSPLFVQGNVPSSDFSYCDISGEVYSGPSFGDDMSFAGIAFQHVQASGTDFTGGDFTGCSFSGYGWLTGAIFVGANLAGVPFTVLDASQANFSSATLTKAVFSCPLKEAVFTGAQLAGATFHGSDLTGVKFDGGADLTGADFTGSLSIKSCSFRNANLTGANFDRLDLTGVDFTGANLTGTVLTNTDLTPATFSIPPQFSTTAAQLTKLACSTLNYDLLGLDWSYLDLTDATIIGLPASLPNLKALSAVLINMQLPSTDLNNADFSSADMRQCDLSKSNLQKANFTGAQLQGDAIYDAASLAEANLENANFTNANLTGTDLSLAFLWGDQATLTGATLIRTTFTNAYLVALDFSDIAQNQCQGSNFDQSCLINAKFNGTNAGTFSGQRTSFVKACLHGADFRDAKLDGANLASAGVAQSSGTFPVTLPSVPVPIHITYARGTLGIEAATDGKSICPNQQDGPCTVAQQSASDAPSQWPVHSAVNRLSLGALGALGRSSEGPSQSTRAPQRAEESPMAWFGPRLIEVLRRCFWRRG